MSDVKTQRATPPHGERRYSLREIMEEVQVERLSSHFGRQLVDDTEIEKMFSKRKLKKKKST